MKRISVITSTILVLGWVSLFVYCANTDVEYESELCSNAGMLMSNEVYNYYCGGE